MEQVPDFFNLLGGIVHSLLSSPYVGPIRSGGGGTGGGGHVLLTLLQVFFGV